MLLKHLIELYDILDSKDVDGEAALKYLRSINPEVDAETYPLVGDKGRTHMVRVRIPGTRGKKA